MDNEADEMAAMQQSYFDPAEHYTEESTPPSHQHYLPIMHYHEGGVVGGVESGGEGAMNVLAAAEDARQASPASSSMGAPISQCTGNTMTVPMILSTATTATPQQQQQLTTPSPPLSATMQYIPPAGRVVESGQEHTGRWTRDEHEAFLSGLKLYGKEWKKVAARVKTRTVVQTRTHAQKYFQKMTKVCRCLCVVHHVSFILIFSYVFSLPLLSSLSITFVVDFVVGRERK